MPCPGCNGAGCDQCDQEGSFYLTQCPKQFIGAELAQMLPLVDLFFEGTPPVAGGTLDQTKFFFDFATLVRSEDNLLEAAKNKELR